LRPEELISPGAPPLAFRSSPESRRSAAVAVLAPSRSSGNCLPCGSFPLRRFPGGGQLLTPQRLPASGLRCLLSVSHALKAFFRPPPAGLVSCRSRPWGLPFRVLRHPRSDRLSRASCPLVVSLPSSRCAHCCGFAQNTLGYALTEPLHFFGPQHSSGRPTSGPCSPRVVRLPSIESWMVDATLLGFTLLRALFLLAGGPS